MLQFHILHVNAHCNYNITSYTRNNKCDVHYHAYNTFNEICYLYHVNLPRMALLRCEKKTLIRLKLPLYEHNMPSFQDVVM